MTVLTSINQLITMPLSGICQGGQPLISYNYGAKKFDRVKEAFFCQFFTCVGYTVVFWAVIQFKTQPCPAWPFGVISGVCCTNTRKAQ